MAQANYMRRIVWYALVASLAAILFGYDTAVIAGAIAPLSSFFNLSPAGTGWAVSSALLGCVIGAFFAGVVSDAVGRKNTLFIAAACYALSAVGSALAWDFTSFWVMRALGGVGIGFSAVVPMYVGEISPKEHRGKLASLYQLAITLGILVVYIVNFLISENAPADWMRTVGWRIMLGSEIIPSIVFIALVFAIPESPRWLLMKGKTEDARKICALVMPAETVDASVAEIEKSIAHDKAQHINLRTPGVPFLIFIAVAIAVLQQAVGINVIIYYGTSFMSQLGIGGENGAFVQSVMIGAVNFLSTFLGIIAIDRLGRKPLLIIGSAGVLVAILTVGVALFVGAKGPWLIAPILLYIVFFAAGLGPLPWVVLGEIAPSFVRAKVLSIGIFALWIANIVVSQTFPMINDNAVNQNLFNGALPFFVYGFFALLFLVFSAAVLPETRGVSLEDISKRFVKE